MDAASTKKAWINARLATMDPSVEAPYGTLSNHALIVAGETIAALVPMEHFGAARFDGPVHDVGGRWITPGLIDCHTHLVYGGSRVAEWERRLAGVSYAEIASQGGGILSTVRATRAASEQELLEAARRRARALAAEGVTCVEIKSGYGLTTNDELKMLRAAKRLAESVPLEISTTLLAAHTIPPEFNGRSDDYVDLVVEEMIPKAAELGLAEAVDAFCESIAFSPEQCDRIWSAARLNGLAVKGHVEQLCNLHGAVRLAGHQPWSADHLEYLDGEGNGALKGCGAVAVLLPGAYYFLRETQKPPVEGLRKAGVPMAVATDCNPGTSPFASIRFAMNLASVLFGLSPEETLAGATRNAAKALGRADRLGTLTAGKQADFMVWDVEHPAEIVCSLGDNRLVTRVFRGNADALAA